MTDEHIIEGEAVEVPEPAQRAMVVAEPPRDRSKAVAMWEVGSLSDEEFEERAIMLTKGVQRIGRLQRSLLVEGIEADYGQIPGVNRTVLFKSGAEKLAQFYRLVPEFQHLLQTDQGQPTAEHPVMPDRLTVTVHTLLHHEDREGPVVGEGVGVASTYESKYLWRQANRVCPACGKDTIRKSKESGWYCWRKLDGCGKTWDNDKAPEIMGQVVGKIPNMEPYEMLNTVTKIATKRSYVDAVIRALAASALFTQDMEDSHVGHTPDGPVVADGGGGRPAVAGAPAAPRPVAPAPSHVVEMHEGTVKEAPDGVREVKAPDWSTFPAGQVVDKLELVLTVNRQKHTAIVLGPLAQAAKGLAAEAEVRVHGTRVELDYPGRGQKPMRKEIRHVSAIEVWNGSGWYGLNPAAPKLPLADPGNARIADEDGEPLFDEDSLAFDSLAQSAQAIFDPWALPLYQGEAGADFKGRVSVIKVEAKHTTREPIRRYARIDAVFADSRIVIIMDEADALANKAYDLGDGEAGFVLGTWAKAGDSTVVMSAVFNRG